MRRESCRGKERYLFNFPLISDGLNYGNLPESQYIDKLRNYGSTGATPSFNDNLVFDSTYGELAHKHTGNKDKLVSLIQNTFNLSKWLNDNNWELNLDFYFQSYSGYQVLFQINRNLSSLNGIATGFDGRWLTTSFGFIIIDVPYNVSGNTIVCMQDGAPYVTNAWVRMNLSKTDNGFNFIFKTISNDTTFSSVQYPLSNITYTYSATHISLFGDYKANYDSMINSRYCVGATKNFYLKKL